MYYIMEVGLHTSLSAGLNDKMRTVRDNSITISKVTACSPECIEHAIYVSDERYIGLCKLCSKFAYFFILVFSKIVPIILSKLPIILKI